MEHSSRVQCSASKDYYPYNFLQDFQSEQEGLISFLQHLLIWLQRYMAMSSPQQVIDERISFLKKQINHDNKPEVSSTFQIQIDAIWYVDEDDVRHIFWVVNLR